MAKGIVRKCVSRYVDVDVELDVDDVLCEIDNAVLVEHLETYGFRLMNGAEGSAIPVSVESIPHLVEQVRAHALIAKCAGQPKRQQALDALATAIDAAWREFRGCTREHA